MLIVVSVGDMAENKTDKSLCPRRVHVLVEERDDKQTKNIYNGDDILWRR